MKIHVFDTQKKPLTNYKFQLQVRGDDSGFLSLTTDASGYAELDKKYLGQQIATSYQGTQGQWITAADGVSVSIDTATTQGAKDSVRQEEESHH